MGFNRLCQICTEQRRPCTAAAVLNFLPESFFCNVQINLSKKHEGAVWELGIRQEKGDASIVFAVPTDTTRHILVTASRASRKVSQARSLCSIPASEGSISSPKFLGLAISCKVLGSKSVHQQPSLRLLLQGFRTVYATNASLPDADFIGSDQETWTFFPGD